jgi:hypothetical protein
MYAFIRSGNSRHNGDSAVTACVNDRSDLVCIPTAIPPQERAAHFALIQELFGAMAQERAEVPCGYAYRFAAEAFWQVARFVANERKCCPFLTFELSVSPASGPLWLRMSGPEGTRAVLEAELAVTRRQGI